MTAIHTFSGSYRPSEVAFLLTPMALPDTPIAAKEKLIQTGTHYARLLHHETAPAADYVRLFYQGLADNRTRLARDLWLLSRQIADRQQKSVTLVSLARAGTPFGVLLKHLLARYHGIEAAHYSVSLLKGIGIDDNALRFIATHHPPESLVFIDGWTGKGNVARQLYESLQLFNTGNGAKTVPDDLYVIADLCGYATCAATFEDYLIPSCILNATVSGLVSRSIFPENTSNGLFHGCLYYTDLQPYDLSRYFIDTLLIEIEHLSDRSKSPPLKPLDRLQMQAIATQFLEWIRPRYDASHNDFVKPGIGETTRAMLRRQIRLLLLRNPEHTAVRHLRWLAADKAIPIEMNSAMPYLAAAIIKEHKL
jgi:hypothetical protein